VKVNDKRKQSIYVTVEVLQEIQAEANRLGRSRSFVVQRAWKKARQTIREMPE